MAGTSGDRDVFDDDECSAGVVRVLPARMCECNSVLNQTWGPGERAQQRHPQDVELLTELRCCPQRATAVIAAILVLHQAEEQP